MGPEDSIQRVRETVADWIDRYLQTIRGLEEEPLFQVEMTEEGRQTGQSPLNAAESWLDGEGPPVAILSGGMGTGKTVATCMMCRDLSEHGDSDHLNLWIPLSWIGKPGSNPFHDILQGLGAHEHLTIPQFWSLPLRCLILDGVDEFAYLCTSHQLEGWFWDLCKGLSMMPSRPRLLLSGRDVVFSSKNNLTSYLQAFCDGETNGRYPQFRRFGLKPWNERFFRDQLTSLLEEKLQEHFRAETSREVARRLELIAPRVLTSPLFFKLAYEYLSGLHSPAKMLQNQWQLMRRWIHQFLGDPRFSRRTAIPIAERLRAAIGIATYLVLSGRGTSGATLAELETEKDLQWIWDTLRSRPDPTPGNDDDALDPKFLLAVRELKHTTLMSCKDDHYSLFHEQVLVHLAAQGIAYLFSAAGAPGGGKPPMLIGDLGFEGRQPTLEETVEAFNVMATRTRAGAFQPNSPLEQALTYWHVNRGTGSPPPLASIGHLLRDGEEIDPRRDFLALVRNATLRAHPEKLKDLLAEESREVTVRKAEILTASSLLDQLEVEGHVLLPIPAGTYVIWEIRDGFRRLVKAPLSQTLYLARSACTTEQYARFLEHCAEVRRPIDLPGRPDAGWRRHGRSVTFNRALASTPVTGISETEARQYCEWLQTRPLPEGFESAALGLPSSQHLRIAIQGLEAWELPADPGSFGHEGLIHIWHWTADRSDGQQRLVGGSSTVGDLETLRRGWPALERLLPPGSYEPDTGFRVALWLPES